MRKPVVWLWLFLLPWLNFQLQTGYALTHQNLTHQLLHIGHLAHHHESNGDIHFDVSPESTQHLAEHDTCTHQLSLIPKLFMLKLASATLQDHLACATYFLPDPIVQQIQKPPKSH